MLDINKFASTLTAAAQAINEEDLIEFQKRMKKLQTIVNFKPTFSKLQSKSVKKKTMIPTVKEELNLIEAFADLSLDKDNYELLKNIKAVSKNNEINNLWDCLDKLFEGNVLPAIANLLDENSEIFRNLTNNNWLKGTVRVLEIVEESMSEYVKSLNVMLSQFGEFMDILLPGFSHFSILSNRNQDYEVQLGDLAAGSFIFSKYIIVNATDPVIKDLQILKFTKVAELLRKVFQIGLVHEKEKFEKVFSKNAPAIIRLHTTTDFEQLSTEVENLLELVDKDLKKISKEDIPLTERSLPASLAGFTTQKQLLISLSKKSENQEKAHSKNNNLFKSESFEAQSKQLFWKKVLPRENIKHQASENKTSELKTTEVNPSSEESSYKDSTSNTGKF